MTSFRIISTSKFSVLAPSDSVNLIPTVPLLSFLNSPQDHLELILSHLTTAGYFLLTYPPATATSTPLHATITATIASLERAFTPSFTSCGYPIPLPWPPSLTKTVGSVYFNEKDVPMYKLGYDDGTGGVEGNDKDKIREYFRVCGGNVGDVESREGVNRGEIVTHTHTTAHLDHLEPRSLLTVLLPALTPHRRPSVPLHHRHAALDDPVHPPPGAAQQLSQVATRRHWQGKGRRFQHPVRDELLQQRRCDRVGE